MEEDPFQQEMPLYHRLCKPQKSRSYRYYDTPDGEDFIPKLLYTSKYGAYWGVVYGGFVTVAGNHRPKHRIWLLFDIVRRGFPFLLYPVVYTTTTYVVTNMRKKDEVINANIGGALAGFAFGAWHRHGWLTFIATILSGYFCGLKKESVQLGIKFPSPPLPPMKESSWVLRNLDFTLTKEIPGNWTNKSPVEVPPPFLPPSSPPPPPSSVCAGF